MHSGRDDRYLVILGDEGHGASDHPAEPAMLNVLILGCGSLTNPPRLLLQPKKAQFLR